MYRLLVSASFLLVMVTSLEAQTPVTLPSGPGGPPVILPTPVVPVPTGTPVVAPPVVTSLSPTTVAITGKLTLEGPVAKLHKQFRGHTMDKWMLHTDYSIGFLIPGDKINSESWLKLAKKLKVKDNLKAEDIASLGVYSYDGKTFKSAMITVGAKGADRKVYRLALTGINSESFDDAVVEFFAESHHAITEELGKDFSSGGGGKGP